MNILVKVSAGAKTENIVEVAPGVYKVRVIEPPEKGKANERVIELVAEYFKVPRYKVVILSGAGYKEKRIQVEQ